jgi:hypothetical protein
LSLAGAGGVGAVGVGPAGVGPGATASRYAEAPSWTERSAALAHHPLVFFKNALWRVVISESPPAAFGAVSA